MVRFLGNRDTEYQKGTSALRSIYNHIQTPAETYVQDELSSSNEPSPANKPDIDSPVTVDVLTRRQELIDLLYFDEIDARLLSLSDAHNSPLLYPKVALSNFHIRT